MPASTRAFLVAAALLTIASAATAANLKSIPTVYCDDEITLRATAREVKFGDDPTYSFMMRTRVCTSPLAALLPCVGFALLV